MSGGDPQRVYLFPGAVIGKLGHSNPVWGLHKKGISLFDLLAFPCETLYNVVILPHLEGSMAKSSEEERQRYPNLGKLSVAILEHLVESTLGESAIEEVKKPYAEKQIADSLEHSLVKVEAEFIEQYKDQEARDALLQLSIHDFSSISKAIWAFYKNPNDKEFSKLLITKLKEIKSLRGDQVNSAVDFYLNLFRRGLVNVDKELREKIQTLAILDMADGFKELVKRKTDVSAPISQPITNKTEIAGPEN